MFAVSKSCLYIFLQTIVVSASLKPTLPFTAIGVSDVFATLSPSRPDSLPRIPRSGYDLGVLGGTKGAPSDGMPGVRSIWQGLDVLYSLLAYRNYLV